MTGAGRTLWHGHTLNLVRPEPWLVSLATYQDWIDRDPVLDPADANLVSSELRNGHHKPVIDVDARWRLVPSSTHPNQHLYIDAEMTWLRYVCLLAGMRAARLIEPGFFVWSLRRRASFVRPYGQMKTEEERRRQADVQYGWLRRQP